MNSGVRSANRRKTGSGIASVAAVSRAAHEVSGEVVVVGNAAYFVRGSSGFSFLHSCQKQNNLSEVAHDFGKVVMSLSQSAGPLTSSSRWQLSCRQGPSFRSQPSCQLGPQRG